MSVGIGGIDVGPLVINGPAGPSGPSGAVGPTGQDGETGPNGPSGPSGTSGPQGATGDVGPTGPSGATGAEIVGPTGPDGQNYAVGSDLHLSPINASGNQAPTNLSLSFQPAGMVQVNVNGWQIWLADGASETLTADGYFSPTGATARAYSLLTLGDGFYWNATNAGFNLVNGVHFVDFLHFYDEVGP